MLYDFASQAQEFVEKIVLKYKIVLFPLKLTLTLREIVLFQTNFLQ